MRRGAAGPAVAELADFASVCAEFPATTEGGESTVTGEGAVILRMSSTAPPASGPRSRSALAEVRTSPRLLVLMAALLPSAVAIGGLGVARLAFANEAFGSELGIGVLAWVGACVGAALAIPAGVIADLRDSRVVMAGATLVVGLGNLLLGVYLVIDGVQPWELVGAVMLDAAALAFIPASQVRIQAALTPMNARGSADVINLFRLSIGGVIGSLLTLWVQDPTVIVTVSGVVCLATAMAIWLISPAVPGSGRPAGSRPSPSADRLELTRDGQQSQLTLRRVMAARSPLRAIIVIDLCLYFIIPTQMVNLLLVDRQITEAAGLLLALGMAGVLIGRGWPAFIGQPRSLRAAVAWAVAAGTVILGLSAVLMVGDWLLDRPLLLAALIVCGSAVAAFVQCVLAAAVQQQVPDAIRGRLSGALWSGRLVLIAVSVAGAAYLVEHTDIAVYLAVLAVAFAGLLAVTRGLRGLRS